MYRVCIGQLVLERRYTMNLTVRVILSQSTLDSLNRTQKSLKYKTI